MSTRAKWVGGQLTYYDEATQERVLPLAPVVFHDDFLGAVAALPTSAENGYPWISKIVGNGPPTTARGASAANGTVILALEGTDQKQDAVVYFGDQREFSLEQGLVFECRARLTVLPTVLGEAVWGLCGAWADGPDAILYSAFFTADGDGEIYCEMDDHATDRSTTSGVTATAAQTKIYRIDATNVADVRFYIDGVHVATGTTFAYAATGANATLQPYLAVYKSAGLAVGTLTVDEVKLWQKRS
jgi:hypothetical protein